MNLVALLLTAISSNVVGYQIVVTQNADLTYDNLIECLVLKKENLNVFHSEFLVSFEININTKSDSIMYLSNQNIEFGMLKFNKNSFYKTVTVSQRFYSNKYSLVIKENLQVVFNVSDYPNQSFNIIVKTSFFDDILDLQISTDVSDEWNTLCKRFCSGVTYNLLAYKSSFLIGDSLVIYNNNVQQQKVFDVIYEEFVLAFDVYKTVVIVNNFLSFYKNGVLCDDFPQITYINDILKIAFSNITKEIFMENEFWSNVKVTQQYIFSNYYFTIILNGTIVFKALNPSPKLVSNIWLSTYGSEPWRNLYIISKTQVLWSEWSVWSGCKSLMFSTRSRICSSNKWLNCSGSSFESKACSSNPCYMKPIGVYLIPDVFKFLMCTPQQAIYVNCTVNQIFDPKYNKCMDARNYSVSNFCTGKNNGNYRNPWNCNSYIACFGNQSPSEVTCYLSVYNPNINACVYDWQFQCINITTIESPFENSKKSMDLLQFESTLSSSAISVYSLSTVYKQLPTTTLTSLSTNQINGAYTLNFGGSQTAIASQPSTFLVSSSSISSDILLIAYEPTPITSFIVTTSQISIAYTLNFGSSQTAIASQPSTFLVSSSSISLDILLIAYEPTPITSFIVTTSQISIEWTLWSECSKTCGEGTKVRYSYNVFMKSNSEVKNCSSTKCPVHGSWGDWISSKCLTNCGGENIYRIRNCVSPLHNGRNCLGTNNYIEECSFNTVCPVNGKWSMWSLWSLCNQPCEGGIKSRFRICSATKYGGQPCAGNSSETIYCPLNSCKKADVDLRLLFEEDIYLPPSELKDRIEKAISNVYEKSKRNPSFKIMLRFIRNVNP